MRERGTIDALAVAGASSVGLMSAINFLLHSDYMAAVAARALVAFGPRLLFQVTLICWLDKSRF